MLASPSVWHSSEDIDHTAEIYHTVDTWLPQMQEYNPIPSPPYIGLFAEQIGILDNILDSEFVNGFGMVNEEAQNEKLSMGSAEPLEQDPISHSVKRLSHNARERQSRKKLNALYTHLRSLLPKPNPKRKLSIPNTVERAVKYIAELQKEAVKLVKERNKLLSMKSVSHGKFLVTSKSMHSHSDGDGLCSPPVVRLNRTGLRCLEVVMTVYTCRAAVHLSSLLAMLEEEGLDVLNSSTFVSGDKHCHVFHLQMMERSKFDEGALEKKVFDIYERNRRVDF